MDLYWKDKQIPLGAALQIIESGGDGYPRIWKILEIREKKSSDEYYDPESGKSFPLKKVMKSKRLYRKSREGDLLHIPPCTYYLVLEEADPSGAVKKRCFNVDFLSTLQDVRIL